MAADTPPLCVSSVSTNSELENDRELRLKKATFHTRNPIWEAGITIGKRLLAVTHTTAWFRNCLRGKCRVRIYPARSGFIQHVQHRCRTH